MKPKISFYTNIPSPYNLDLFEALSKYFRLRVIYYSRIENGRLWNIDVDSTKYESIVLENNLIGRLVQRFLPEFHFSKKILQKSFYDDSDSIILGGNYFSLNTYLLLLVYFFKNKKIFWFGEKLLPTQSRFKLKIKKLLLSPIFNRCEGIFCVGEEAIQSYRSFGFKGACFNTPYSINNEIYSLNLLDQNIFNDFKKINNPQSKIIILTSGSLIYRKGIDTAIESYLRLPDEIRSKCQLWIIGDGPLKHNFEKITSKCNDIILFGFVEPDLLPFYFLSSNVFLFCSRYDGWAVVVNEAVSAGLPVIVSNQVTAAELIKDGINGYICESEKVNSFTNALQKLITSDSLLSSMRIHNIELSYKINSKSIANKIYNALTDA
jgi:glycosyltransferase involved in cell wall biosynthesis